jgi:excinuclease ABC subunit B
MGRAARNIEGRAVLYADVVTGSIKKALDETARRRELQTRYNILHGLTPESVKSRIHDVLSSIEEADYVNVAADEGLAPSDLEGTAAKLENVMLEAATNLEFERAAELRDRMMELQDRMLMTGSPARTSSITRTGKAKKKGGKAKGRREPDRVRKWKAT